MDIFFEHLHLEHAQKNTSIVVMNPDYLSAIGSHCTVYFSVLINRCECMHLLHTGVKMGLSWLKFYLYTICNLLN